MVTFGDVIRKKRVAMGLSLAEASAACGISKPHIWQLEVGRTNNPTVKTFKTLCNYYGIDQKKAIVLV